MEDTEGADEVFNLPWGPGSTTILSLNGNSRLRELAPPRG